MSFKLLSCYWIKCYLFAGYQKPGSNDVWCLLAHTEPKYFTWSSQESRGSWESLGALQSYSWRSRWATATWWTGRTRETSLSFCAWETWNTRWAGETWVSLCTFKNRGRVDIVSVMRPQSQIKGLSKLDGYLATLEVQMGRGHHILEVLK